MCNTLPNINTTQNMAGIDIQDSSLESIGYHTVPIREGQYGHISKVEEELSELKDALEQGSGTVRTLRDILSQCYLGNDRAK